MKNYGRDSLLKVFDSFHIYSLRIRQVIFSPLQYGNYDYSEMST